MALFLEEEISFKYTIKCVLLKCWTDDSFYFAFVSWMCHLENWQRSVCWNCGFSDSEHSRHCSVFYILQGFLPSLFDTSVFWLSIFYKTSFLWKETRNSESQPVKSIWTEWKSFHEKTWHWLSSLALQPLAVVP